MSDLLLLETDGGVGKIPVGAILTYDGFGHLDMEGSAEEYTFDGGKRTGRFHPLTISLKCDTMKIEDRWKWYDEILGKDKWELVLCSPRTQDVVIRKVG